MLSVLFLLLRTMEEGGKGGHCWVTHGIPRIFPVILRGDCLFVVWGCHIQLNCGNPVSNDAPCSSFITLSSWGPQNTRLRYSSCWKKCRQRWRWLWGSRKWDFWAIWFQDGALYFLWTHLAPCVLSTSLNFRAYRILQIIYCSGELVPWCLLCWSS